MYKPTSKIIIKAFYCLLFFISAVRVVAQDPDNDPSKFLPNITPPSPQAFKFALYGNTPVGLFTGTPNIQLPLFTYKTNNINVPFTINYSSGGIKVDEINNITGLGWNFIGGGVITRIIRNQEDNYYEDYPLKHFDITSTTSDVMKSIYFDFYGGTSGKDSERDLFMFNFMNYSGKFYFDDNNKIVFFERNDIKIEVINNPGDEIYSFLVTTPDGVKYFFQEKEQTMLRTRGAGHSVPSIKFTAWHLNKVVHPKGDEVYFGYTDYIQNYVQAESQQASKSFPSEQECANGQRYIKPISFSGIVSHDMRIIGKRMESITSNKSDFGSVNFTYENKIATGDPGTVIKTITIKDKSSKTIEKIDFDYLVTTNKRIFLNGFHFLEESNKYVFTYISPDEFPSRLSKSQDHWGYYNSANNSMLIPKINDYGFESFNYQAANREVNGFYAKMGLLKKIVYPTKGYTELNYESNTYYGEKKITDPPIHVNLYVTTGSDEYSDIKSGPEFSVSSNQRVDFVGGISYFCYDEQDDTGKTKATISVYNKTSRKNETLYFANNGMSTQQSLQLVPGQTPNQRKFYFTARPNQVYVVKLSTSSRCTSATVNYSYSAGVIRIIPSNIAIGGLRVESTKDYSLYKSNPVTKKYYYSKHNELQKSSGDFLEQPYYINFSDHASTSRLNDLTCTVTDLVLNSSSVSSLFEMGSNVFYKYVTVSNGEGFENGCEENEFIVNKDYRENIYSGDREFRNVPWTNLGWNNGKLLTTKTFEIQGNKFVLRKEVVNNYVKDPNTPTLTNFAIYNPSYNIVRNEVRCVCAANTFTERYPVKYCSAIHFHQRDANNNCIANGANNINTFIDHLCITKNAAINEIIYIPTIIAMDVMPYKYMSYFTYLANTSTSLYDKNGENPLTTISTYNYQGQKHLQLTSQSTESSVGENVQSKFYYPSDLLSSNQSANMQKLVSQNRIDTPVKTQSFVNTVKTSENVIKYEESSLTGNLLLPKEIHELKGVGDINVTSSIDRKITYTLFDADNANVLEYKIENGATVAIIWGYNKTKPIAKIENATYSEVNSYVINLQNLSNLDNDSCSTSTCGEQQLRNALNTLRTALPYAMVTTYTYDPLIGLTSLTDPKGMTAYYIYDEYNRLKVVKDANENILSQNQYHYKTN